MPRVQASPPRVCNAVTRPCQGLGLREPGTVVDIGRAACRNSDRFVRGLDDFVNRDFFFHLLFFFLYVFTSSFLEAENCDRLRMNLHQLRVFLLLREISFGNEDRSFEHFLSLVEQLSFECRFLDSSSTEIYLQGIGKTVCIWKRVIFCPEWRFRARQDSLTLFFKHNDSIVSDLATRFSTTEVAGNIARSNPLLLFSKLTSKKMLLFLRSYR